MSIPPPDSLAEDAIHSYRLLAVHLLEYACDGSRGRPETDPVYLHQVTEGRDQGAMRKRYSSCGDLAHWMWYRLGVRLDWLNREEHGRYGVGHNILRICGSNEVRPALATQRFAPGDVVVIANNWPRGSDAHVVCIIDHEGEHLQTAEYGQPGGALCQRRFRHGMLGSRAARVVAPLAVVLRSAFAQGLLVAADDPTRDDDGTPRWTP